MFYDRGEYTGGEHSWRYLEAAPSDLHLINGVPTIDSTMGGYSNGTKYFIFGYFWKSSTGAYVSLGTKQGIGEGFGNTNILVGNMKESACTSYFSKTDTTPNYAARLCDVLEYKVKGKRFDNWFLPSKDELNLMYKNLHEQGQGSFANNYYWSSSEYDKCAAWRQNFDDGSQYYGIGFQYKIDRSSDEIRVRPVRAF